MSRPGRRRLLLVVGVGRSGTSLMSGILGQLGFHIPQPEVKADETNPHGFGEPRWVVDFHTRLLRQQKVTVNDARPAAFEKLARAAEEPAVTDELSAWLGEQLRVAEALVVKDPRTVWLLPLWRRCAERHGLPVSYVTMLRHPAEVVMSARRSYGPGMTLASRTSAWLNVILETERLTRGEPRAFVRYEDLLADWAPQIRRTGELIGSARLAAVDGDPRVDAFVDPTLHRSRVTWDELEIPARVRELGEPVWERLQRLALAGGDTPEAHRELDAAHAAYQVLYAEAEAIAQSSVMAARPRKKAPAPAPPSLRVRVARRIPKRVRQALRGRS
jgi:hypothetical protein